MFWFLGLLVYFAVRFVVFGWIWLFGFCYLCLLVFVNSVVHWLVMYCMYGLVTSFSFFGLGASCWFVIVCICLVWLFWYLIVIGC